MEMIKVYSTPSCYYCNYAKEQMDNKGIPYESIDVSKNPKALEYIVKKTGKRVVPVFEKDGELLVGWDDKVERVIMRTPR